MGCETQVVLRKEVVAFIETGSVSVEIQRIAQVIEEMVKPLDVDRIGNRSLIHSNAATRGAFRELRRSS